MTKIFKKTILLDLDGVLNTYIGEYDANFIPPIKDGAFEFVKELAANYEIVLFTSRNLLLASKWVAENKLTDYISDVTNIKKSCYLIIDDRCITFNGDFNDLKNKISKFQAWYK